MTMHEQEPHPLEERLQIIIKEALQDKLDEGHLLDIQARLADLEYQQEQLVEETERIDARVDDAEVRIDDLESADFP